MHRFVEAVQQAVFQSSFPVEDLARRLKKSPSTLYSELNPFPNENSTHKLGLEDAMLLMEIVGDSTPLVYINDHFNRDSRPRETTPDKPDLHSEILDNHPAIVDYEQAMLRGESIEEVGKKRETAIQELEQDFVLYRQQQSKIRNIG